MRNFNKPNTNRNAGRDKDQQRTKKTGRSSEKQYGKSDSYGKGGAGKKFAKKDGKSERRFDEDRREKGKPFEDNREGGRSRKPYAKRDGERSGGSEGKRPYSRERGERDQNDRSRKPFVKRDGERSGRSEEKRPYNRERGERDQNDRSRKPYAKRDGERHDRSEEKRPYNRERGERDQNDRSRKPYAKRDGERSGGFEEKRPYNRERGERDQNDRARKPFVKRDGERSGGFGEKRPFNRESSDRDNDRPRRPFVKRDEDRPSRFEEKRPFRSEGAEEGSEEKQSYKQKRSFTRNKEFRENPKFGQRSSELFGSKKSSDFRNADGHKRPFERKLKPAFDSDSESIPKEKTKSKQSKSSDGLTRLNKYLSNAGIASRREADVLIKSGVVKVNGVPVTEMGFKIKPGDEITYGDEKVKSEKKVYLLLNKPKDYITTMDDPQERRTVMALIEGACRERVYPVGRLDRNTTGLLLFTNDGELTKKLTHPKHGIKKLYHVTLNHGLKTEDFQSIIEGVELEDGIIKADDLAFTGEGKKEVGIEIHSGRNRVVRRLFEHLGYEVVKLDRVSFAGLTKKELPRGKYRFLSPKEVNFLQMIG